jgi:hypothetical protein
VIDRFGLDRVGVDDRSAGIAERLVHRVDEGVDIRRLRLARDHNRCAAVGLEIPGDRIDPFRGGGRDRWQSIGAPDSSGGGGQMPRYAVDFTRLECQTMIRA